MLTDNVVDLPVFLGEGDAEIALSQVFQEDQILRANGFVETIFGFEIGADFFRKRLVAGSGSPGTACSEEGKVAINQTVMMPCMSRLKV